MEDISEPPPYPQDAGVEPEDLSPTRGYRDLVTHSVSLKDRHGREYATLNVASCARSPDHMPILYEGELLKGSLDLDLVQETYVKSVTISVSSWFDCLS